jgi:hypothetical protein
LAEEGFIRFSLYGGRSGRPDDYASATVFFEEGQTLSPAQKDRLKSLFGGVNPPQIDVTVFKKNGDRIDFFAKATNKATVEKLDDVLLGLKEGKFNLKKSPFHADNSNVYSLRKEKPEILFLKQGDFVKEFLKRRPEYTPAKGFIDYADEKIYVNMASVDDKKDLEATCFHELWHSKNGMDEDKAEAFALRKADEVEGKK